MHIEIGVYELYMNNDNYGASKLYTTETFYSETEEELINKIYETCLHYHKINLEKTISRGSHWASKTRYEDEINAINEVKIKSITDFDYADSYTGHYLLLIGDIILGSKPVQDTMDNIHYQHLFDEEKNKHLEKSKKNKCVAENAIVLKEIELMNKLKEKYE